jgi:cell wall assembly regulator SMI1
MISNVLVGLMLCVEGTCDVPLRIGFMDDISCIGFVIGMIDVFSSLITKWVDYMSEISKYLEYILSWLRSTEIEFIDCFNPGLTRQQIDDYVRELPSKLSDEMYELYQWRNGIVDLGFNNYHPLVEFLFPDQLHNGLPTTFHNIKDSVANYNDLYQVSQEFINPSSDSEFWNQKWFPFASFENKKILYVIGDLNPSPVYFHVIGNLDNPIRVYKSITSMAAVITECCVQGLYQIMANEDDVVVCIDEDKLDIEKEIYRKYNS